MRTTWKVSGKQCYWLIPAVSREKAEARAREVGATAITRIERHIPRPWPDLEAEASHERRAEATKRQMATRKRAQGGP